MFSSLSQNKEISLPPKLKEGDMKPVSCTLALDCFGEIMSFNRSVNVLKNLFLSSKHVKNYFEEVNPGSCRRVKFYFMNQPQSPLKYVFNLQIIGDSKKNGCNANSFNNRDMSAFPALEKLVIRKNRYVDWKLFKSCPNLVYLSIESCEDLVRKSNFYEAKKIRTLKLDCSHNVWKNRKISLSGFSQLEDLEILDVHHTHLRGLRKGYKISSKLRIMKLRGEGLLDDGVFKMLPNLEILELNNCERIRSDGFKHLKKLEELTVECCDGIWERSKITESLGYTPKNFKFSEPMPLKGDIAPITSEESD